METEDEKKENNENKDICQKAWAPTFYCRLEREIHYYAGYEIKIMESLDSYGATIWPAAVALCEYLDSNRGTVNLLDKAVLEIGAGTGLVSIVASLLGAWVTATDLPEVLGNLRSNLSRNTRGRCRYTPQVAELSWGHELENTFPHSVYHYDYILAADVVYHHDFLAELLVTMRHFTQPGTTLIWANKVRFGTDLTFTEDFKKVFNTKLLADLGDIKIYTATSKCCDVEENLAVMLKDKAKEPVGPVTCKDMGIKQNQNANKDADFVSVEGKKSESHKFGRQERNKPNKEIYDFVGHKIRIDNPTESFGGLKATITLGKFLETAEGQEQINLFDRRTLELGARTGLLSVIATLLGADVTVASTSDVIDKLQADLNQNSEGSWRHKPQTISLNWGDNHEQTFPNSESHYEYVLTSDVVHHLTNQDELLATMRHFCQPGTNLIMANKVSYPYYLVFIEKFKSAFHATLLQELDGVQIYLATHRVTEKEDKTEKISTDNEMEETSALQTAKLDDTESVNNDEDATASTLNGHSEENISNLNNEATEMNSDNSDLESTEKDTESEESGESKAPSNSMRQESENPDYKGAWRPVLCYRPGREIHYFLDQKITIEESFDSYGAMIWPGAVAFCKYLETTTGQQQINLLDKTVLELGAGTGLLSIVVTLLGARLTATDLPEILSNLRFNLNRNTRTLRRHDPQVMELSWGYELEDTFPRRRHHYDYVLAADVVYHHGFLGELLATMQHFCQPGTTLIWANKIRYKSDLVFIEKFENVFHTTLLAEQDEIRIYSATWRSPKECG